MKRNVFVVFLLSLLLGLSLSAICRAASNPSGLVVVRGADGSLWKATCLGTSCSAFTSFPGNFSSQPTVYWDEEIKRYIIWGRASDSSIWRASFNQLGSFNNDWASVPGSTPSPVAGAGGILSYTFSVIGTDLTGIVVNTTATEITSRSIACPYNGMIEATATGTVDLDRSSTTNYSYVNIGLNTSATMPLVQPWVQVPPGTPVGVTSFHFSVSRLFGCTGGTTITVYLVAQRDNYGSMSGADLTGVTLFVKYLTVTPDE